MTASLTGTFNVEATRYLYIQIMLVLYTSFMDVSVTELRAHLSNWLSRISEGEDIVVTDRGLPVARLVSIDSANLLERLTARGVIARPTSNQRPLATGRPRPRVVHPLADVVSDQRG